jgi:hypothetical protein
MSLEKNKDMFIVKYYGGSWDDSYTRDVFITSDEKVAKFYVKKFNRIITAYKEFYKSFEEDYYGHSRIRDEHMDYFDRWFWLDRITKAYYEVIEQR